jgi:IS30 family transposase
MEHLSKPDSLSEVETDIWRRWRAGEAMALIGRDLDKNSATIFNFLRRHGGIKPPDRTRSTRVLGLREREEISRGLAAGLSMRQIARELDRAPSTISREIRRHGGINRYRAIQADKRAWSQAKRPKPCRFAENASLRQLVARKLAQEWSPEQIAGWLKAEYSDDRAMQISHETIYRSLYIQARGVLKKELQKKLRSGRVFRHSKHKKIKGATQSKIIDAVHISERPPEVADRAIPGHWEGDLIAGSHNTYIATLVERHSRFTMLIKVDGKDTATVTNALARHVKQLPDVLRRSLTWDRGSEMSGHKDFTVATDVDVYFCDPKSPWQRGTNENTNGLLRQYFPKGTDLSVHSQKKLNAVAKRLNQRPRKTLGFRTPADKLSDSVASTS